MKSPHIVFTATDPAHRDLLWNQPARDFAAKRGWQVDLPEVDTQLTSEEWAEFFAEADAIITTWGAPPLNGITLRHNTRLRFVGHAAGSAANIVSPELFRRNIPISTANREMADAVARWGLMMTLVALRGLVQHAQLGAFSPLRWDQRNNGRDARNSTIGIWGFGDISRSLVELLRPLEPGRVLVCSRSLPPNEAAALGVELTDLETLFAESDVLHLLQSLTEATRGLVRRPHLNRLKSGATLINAGRAHLVDERDLLHALREQPIFGIFDTHYEEPVRPDSPFRGLPNVILTPHCAGKENYYLFVKIMLEEFDRLLCGEPLKHQVSADRIHRMTDESLRRT